MIAESGRRPGCRRPCTRVLGRDAGLHRRTSTRRGRRCRTRSSPESIVTVRCAGTAGCPTVSHGTEVTGRGVSLSQSANTSRELTGRRCRGPRLPAGRSASVSFVNRQRELEVLVALHDPAVRRGERDGRRAALGGRGWACRVVGDEGGDGRARRRRRPAWRRVRARRGRSRRRRAWSGINAHVSGHGVGRAVTSIRGATGDPPVRAGDVENSTRSIWDDETVMQSVAQAVERLDALAATAPVRTSSPGRSPTPDTTSRSSAAPSVRLPGRPVTDLDFTTDARPGRRPAHRRADRECHLGRRAPVRHHRRAGRGRAGSRSPRTAATCTTARPAIPRSRSATLSRRPAPSRLHGQRDGAPTPPARARRRARRCRGPALSRAGCTRRRPRRCPSATTPLRMMRAARFTAQLGFTVSDEVRDAMVELVDLDRDRVGRTRARRVVKLLNTPTRARRAAASTHRARRALPARTPRDAARRSTSTTTTRTCTSTRSPCSRRRSGTRQNGNPARLRTPCCGSRRSCTTSASRPPEARPAVP